MFKEIFFQKVMLKERLQVDRIYNILSLPNSDRQKCRSLTEAKSWRDCEY